MKHIIISSRGKQKMVNQEPHKEKDRILSATLNSKKSMSCFELQNRELIHIYDNSFIKGYT